MLQVSRYAPWRRRAPSERQLQLLKILKGVKAGGEGTEEVRIMGKTVAINDLTAGELSSYLCAAKHGALRRRGIKDHQDTRRGARMERKADKERALAARNLPLPDSA